LEFIYHYGTGLQGDLKKLDSAWSLFLATSKYLGAADQGNKLSPLIRLVS
jgi:hypothetical protein